MLGVHVAHQLQAIALGQRDVDDDDIRLQLADGRARLALALRFAAHVEVRLQVDHQPQALPHDRMIVDDQHLARLGRAPSSGSSSGHEQRTEAPPLAQVSSMRSPPSICAR